MQAGSGRWRRGVQTLACICVCAGGLAACESIQRSSDFERHRHSRLSEPYDRNDVMYFDVRFDTAYPDEDPGAESIRLEWLAAWLRQRKMCVEGYEIVKRRPFGTMEDNPARYDVRYEVTCKPGVGS
ncbi:MAG: hypothetical protein ACE5G3_04605 [Gammaproteobacteria bacterium]